MPTEPTAQPALISVPGPDADVPVLAVDLGNDAPELAAFLTSQERARLRTAALDELRDIGLHSITPGAYLPDPVDGWLATFSPGRLDVRAPTHLVYGGSLPSWPAYTSALEAGGRVLLYAGHLALGWGADGMQAVREAADRGEVLGGIIRARWTTAT